MKSVAVNRWSSKKIDMRNFLKRNLAKGSCKKGHSNYQRKYFSESSESMDVSSKSCWVERRPLFREKDRDLAVYSYKEIYSRGKACIAMKHEWRSDVCTVYGFFRTKEEMLKPHPSGHCLFYLVKVIRLQDISKTCEVTAFYSSR